MPKKTRRVDSRQNSDDESSEISMATTASNMSLLSVDTIPMSRGGSQRSMQNESIESSPLSGGSVEELHQAFEQLESKRTSQREEALRSIVKCLSHRFHAETVQPRLSSWIDAVTRIARREGNGEAELAHRVLVLIWITAGSLPTYYSDVIKMLDKGIQDGSESLKASSVLALAVISFIEDPGHATIWEIMESIEDVLLTDEIDPLVSKSALEAFGLLYTATAKKIGREDFNRIVDEHSALLESNDVDVRIAAGENLAIMFEDLDASQQSDDPQPGASLQNTKALFCDAFDELVRQLAFLAKESTKHRSKKDKAVQKSAFRDILDTIESSISPTIRLKIKQEVIACDSWAKIRRLNVFRDAIGEGMHVHFEHNPVVQSIFQFSLQGSSDRTRPIGADRRLIQTAVEKARTKAINDMRGSRNAFKSSSME